MAERYIVVGGGLAGLMTVIKLAEAGKHVDVFSIVPVKRSHSVCAQGGINGAVNTKGEGDHPDIHVKDTLKGGDFLAEQPPVKGMCYAAPHIIYMLDRMGVPFNRTPEGLLDFRRFGGTLFNRTAFAGASTGQQLLYALDEQARRYEAEGLVRKFEYWEYLGFIRDEGGSCRGIVAMDLRSMDIQAYPADAVCLATGGPGIVYGRSTNSLINTGSANGRSYMDGAIYSNAEFVQVHPTAIPGEDKHRLMSESARGEGGRIWVPKQKGDKRQGKAVPEGERDYFLETKYPHYGNLVPRDVATREIFAVRRDVGDVEVDRVTAVDAKALIAADGEDLAGGDVAGNEVAVVRVTLLEKVPALAVGNLGRVALVALGFRHPDARPLAAQRLGNEAQLVGPGDRRRVHLDELAVGIGRALLIRSARRRAGVDQRLRRASEDEAGTSRRNHRGIAGERAQLE